MIKFSVYMVLVGALFYAGFFSGAKSKKKELLQSHHFMPVFRASNEFEFLLELKNEIVSLAEIDLAEYLELKTHRERYQKANLILGKVFKLFLVNVGLKLDEKKNEFINNPYGFLDKKSLINFDKNFKDKEIEIYLNKKEQCEKKTEVKKVDSKKTILDKKRISLAQKTLELETRPTSFPDYFIGGIGRNIPKDLFHDYWFSQFSKKELNPLYLSHIQPFIGSFYGIYRTKNGFEQKVVMTNRVVKESSDENVKMDVHMKRYGESDDIFFAFLKEFEFFHPVTHQHRRGDSCRGVMGKTIIGDREFHIYFIRVPETDILVGKIVSLDKAKKNSKVHGTLLLAANNRKIRKSVSRQGVFGHLR